MGVSEKDRIQDTSGMSWRNGLSSPLPFTSLMRRSDSGTAPTIPYMVSQGIMAIPSAFRTPETASMTRGSSAPIITAGLLPGEAPEQESEKGQECGSSDPEPLECKVFIFPAFREPEELSGIVGNPPGSGSLEQDHPVVLTVKTEVPRLDFRRGRTPLQVLELPGQLSIQGNKLFDIRLEAAAVLRQVPVGGESEISEKADQDCGKGESGHAEQQEFAHHIH